MISMYLVFVPVSGIVLLKSLELPDKNNTGVFHYLNKVILESHLRLVLVARRTNQVIRRLTLSALPPPLGHRDKLEIEFNHHWFN